MGTIGRRAFLKRSGSAALLSAGGALSLSAGGTLPMAAGRGQSLTAGGTLPMAAGGGLSRSASGDSSTVPSAGRILPGRLNPGDRVGLVTPGSPVRREQLEETVQKLEGLGWKVSWEETVLSEYGYFAGKDRERAEELMAMFTRPDIDAIWCVRGGYGCIRILDLLDYVAIARHPKLLIGYSDITALHTAIFAKTGLVTFHGPLGISEFNRFSVRALKSMITDPGGKYRFPYRREKETRGNPEFDRYTLRGGQAQGLLTGGNISVLHSLIGTAFEPDFRGRIAYLEEVEEKTYRVDKMLFHLLSATNLKEASGIVMGAFLDCDAGDEPRLRLEQAIRDLVEPLDIPASYGHSFGHIDRMVTLPNGILARLDADRHTLEILEPTVS